MANRKSIDKEFLKEEGKYILKFYAAAAKNIFPMTEGKKNEYKEYLNEIKDYYQEKIEERTGVSLGGIEVKLSSEFSEDAVYKYLIDYLNNNGEEAKCRNNEYKNYHEIGPVLPGMLYSVLKPIEKLTHSMAHASYSPFTGNIYFSDEYMPRLLRDIDENEDKTMLHELSHALWDSLKEESVRETTKTKGGKEWSEGFAEYGAISYFYDFLLPGKYMNNSNKTIQNGIKKVKSTVEKHGPEAHLEIPNRWKEFEKEITVKYPTK